MEMTFTLSFAGSPELNGSLCLELPAIYQLATNRHLECEQKEAQFWYPLEAEAKQLRLALETQTTVEGAVALLPATKPLFEKLLGVKL